MDERQCQKAKDAILACLAIVWLALTRSVLAIPQLTVQDISIIIQIAAGTEFGPEIKTENGDLNQVGQPGDGPCIL